MMKLTLASVALVLMTSSAWAGPHSSVDMAPGTTAPDLPMKNAPSDYPKKNMPKDSKVLLNESKSKVTLPKPEATPVKK